MQMFDNRTNIQISHFQCKNSQASRQRRVSKIWAVIEPIGTFVAKLKHRSTESRYYKTLKTNVINNLIAG
ncbi:hypothetical protein ADP73_12650 [Serratia plymuthica]|nr:hypothetical protein ADP73_12650 [Serratia plymuthica]